MYSSKWSVVDKYGSPHHAYYRYKRYLFEENLKVFGFADPEEVAYVCLVRVAAPHLLSVQTVLVRGEPEGVWVC